jgi:MATE family multidrug resistance protein
MGPLSLGMSLMNYQLFLIYGIWIFPEMGIGAAIGTIVLVLLCCFMHYILIRKPKFHPYFENFSLKEIKKNAK